MDYNRTLVPLAIFISAATLLGIGVSLLRLPPEVPVFYSRPWGGDQLASPFWLFFPPIFSLLIFFGNLAWARTLAKEKEFLARILVFGGLVTILLSSITVARIILLVI